MSKLLKFEGYNYLRQRLVLATLSGKPVRIEKIRSDDENPGLRGMTWKQHFDSFESTTHHLRHGRFRNEVSQLAGEDHQRFRHWNQLYRYAWRAVDPATHLQKGWHHELGTSILYRPGAIEGGRIEHDCGTDRSISYFLEPMVALAPFSKKPFVLILQGITTDHIDPSVRTDMTLKRTAYWLVMANRWTLFVQYYCLNWRDSAWIQTWSSRSQSEVHHH